MPGRSKTNILILGSSGILGRQVLYEFQQHSEFNLGILIHKSRADSYSPELKTFQGDILNKESLKAPLLWTDIIINCTGKVSYRRKDRKLLQQLHIDGTRNIVEVCEQLGKKLIHTSSACVYGSSDQPHPFTIKEVDRERVYQTRSAYYITKYESEQLVLKSSIPKIILRPGSLVHEGHSTMGTIHKLLSKGIFPMLPGGASFIELKDVACIYPRLVEHIIANPSKCNEVINPGGQNMSFKQLADEYLAEHPRKVLRVPYTLLYSIGVLNNYLVEPVFGWSPLPLERVRLGKGFCFMSTK